MGRPCRKARPFYEERHRSAKSLELTTMAPAVLCGAIVVWFSALATAATVHLPPTRRTANPHGPSGLRSSFAARSSRPAAVQTGASIA